MCDLKRFTQDLLQFDQVDLVTGNFSITFIATKVEKKVTIYEKYC